METLLEYKKYLVKFLKRKANPFSGYILGLSGGIDSAVAAVLAQEAIGENLQCVFINVESNENDLNDARELAKKFGIKLIELDLTNHYHDLVKTYEKIMPLSTLSKINLKVRLRMVSLYALGQTTNKLVLGTDNKAELYTGYFTKYGDGGVDLLVLSDLNKGEVKELAKLIGVTSEIINKAPSAGLYAGQSDESEMGLTYAELDLFLDGKKIEATSEAKIARLHKVSAHKRDPLPRPRKRVKDGN